MKINFKKVVCAVGIIAMMSGCASSTEERVLSRADHLKVTPAWATFTNASFAEGDQIKFIGIHEMPDGQRLTSGCKIAQNKAKGEISSGIEQRLSFVFQHAEEGSEFGDEQTKYIGGEASKLTMSALHYDGCYWERIAIPSGVGSYDVRYRFFAKMSMSQQALRKAIRQASGGKLSTEFSKQVTDHWNDLTGAPSTSAE